MDLFDGVIVLRNQRGTVFGVWFELFGLLFKVVYAMFGVLHEMYVMFIDEVLFELMCCAGRLVVIVHWVLCTVGMWELVVVEVFVDVVSGL